MQTIMNKDRGTLVRIKDRDTLLKELGDLIKMRNALSELDDDLTEVNAKIVLKKSAIEEITNG